MAAPPLGQLGGFGFRRQIFNSLPRHTAASSLECVSASEMQFRLLRPELRTLCPVPFHSLRIFAIVIPSAARCAVPRPVGAIAPLPSCRTGPSSESFSTVNTSLARITCRIRLPHDIIIACQVVVFQETWGSLESNTPAYIEAKGKPDLSALLVDSHPNFLQRTSFHGPLDWLSPNPHLGATVQWTSFEPERLIRKQDSQDHERRNI